MWPLLSWFFAGIAVGPSNLDRSVTDLCDGKSAIDYKCLSSDIRARIARKENHRAGQLFRLAHSADQHAGHLSLDISWLVLVSYLRPEKAWRDRVHPNSLPTSPLLGEISGQAKEPGLCCRIRRLRRASCGDPEHTADVDDGASRLH